MNVIKLGKFPSANEKLSMLRFVQAQKKNDLIG